MWNWNNNKNCYWDTPSEEAYYLAAKWCAEPGKKLLDIGAGIGRHALFFAKQGIEVTALDISSNGLNIIRNKADTMGLTIRTIAADMHSIPLENECFDYIVAYHSIYHTDYSGLTKIIKEMHRLLKKGGEIFLTLLSENDSEFITHHKESDNKTLIKREEEGTFLTHLYLNENDIRQLFHEFTIIRIKEVKEYFKKQNPCHFHLILTK